MPRIPDDLFPFEKVATATAASLLNSGAGLLDLRDRALTKALEEAVTGGDNEAAGRINLQLTETKAQAGAARSGARTLLERRPPDSADVVITVEVLDARGRPVAGQVRLREQTSGRVVAVVKLSDSGEATIAVKRSALGDATSSRGQFIVEALDAAGRILATAPQPLQFLDDNFHHVTITLPPTTLNPPRKKASAPKPAAKKKAATSKKAAKKST